MTNVQIAIDESLLDEVNKAGELHGLDLTQVIREALQAWLKRREGLHFEQDWIVALKKIRTRRAVLRCGRKRKPGQNHERGQ